MNDERGDVREAELVAEVDRHPDAHRATVHGEVEILTGLYGESDAGGFFRGSE